MSDHPLQIAFLWHHHQPYYKNSRGVYQMPWVRFHGTKDYLDMLLLMAEYPEVRHTINLVPSLLLQIQDYVENGARDNVWLLSEKPAGQLTEEDRRTILDNFFLANTQHMIKPYARYYELYLKYKYDAPQSTSRDRLEQFSEEDFRDLQIWYNLTWIGGISRRRPEIKALFEKGARFGEEDKKVLFTEIQHILAEIVPLHRKLWDGGQIEVITSPFYHPILPLLIDNRVARVATPEVRLPAHLFAHPEDAEEQIRRGLEYLKQIFGRAPQGLWPSEGSVSEATAQMIARHNINWMASDEAILSRSAGARFAPTDIYRPHRFHGSSHSIHLFFRDHYLSDTIGFVYSNWEAGRAVDDFIGRLHDVRERILDKYDPEQLKHFLVSIILDGENCWEHYPADGHPFLHTLFQRLTADPLIHTRTFSDFLETGPEMPNLYQLYAGSWINGNFNIWIGAEEDNRAWDLLKQARDFLVQKEREGVLTDVMPAEAWEQIYIAEGSDWCWWYGDEHSSAHDQEFDRLFREHLMKVYDICGGEPPAALYQTIKHSHYDRFASIRPHSFIQPTLDGRVTHYYEWIGAAAYDSRLSPHAAMHQVTRIIDTFYVGFDRERFYFRIDFTHKPDVMYEYVLAAKMPHQMMIVISPLRGVIEKFETHAATTKKKMLAPDFKLKNIFEAAVSFADLGLQTGEIFGFQLIIKQNGQQVEIFPNTNIIQVEVPDENYELREWHV